MWGIKFDGLPPPDKIIDVKVFLAKEQTHVFSVSEVNFHRNELNPNVTEYSTDNLNEKLKIPGYTTLLPDSWYTFNVARIICYVSDEVIFKQRHLPPSEHHLQSILLEVGFGRSKKVLINCFYREWKSCVTGDGSAASQMSSLLQLLAGWRRCTDENKDFVAMGDANLDAKQWLDPWYRHLDLAREVHSFLLGESCVQLVEDFTRTRIVGDILQRSSLDHIIVNCSDRVNRPIISSIGRSDHCCISITKYTQDLRTTPKTVMKRVYKNFDKQSFLTD